MFSTYSSPVFKYIMKHFLLFLLFLFVFVHSAFSGYTTPNSGVRWNFDSLVANSGGIVTGIFPSYTVKDTLFIAPNDLLEIRKGSEIAISYRKGITIRGGCIALGSADSLITFTRSDSTWQELRFEDSAVDSLCIMEYVVVEYARVGLNFVNASPALQYSTVRNTGTITGTLSGSGNYGIQCFNSNAVLRHDSIYNNAQYGININSGSSPQIEHCIIFNNNLQGTAFKNQISIGAQGINSPMIRDNEIYHTTPNIKVGGISISAFFSGSGSNAVIEHNYIHNNAYGIAIGSQGSSTLQVSIRNNRIVKNTYSDPIVAGSGINFNSYSPSVQKTIVAGNEIADNSWGVTILGNATPNLGNLANDDSTDDGRNVFINNRNRDTVFALYNNSPGPISAENNYWGTNDSNSVARVIFDSSDISSLGRVSYMPFLTVTSIVPVESKLKIPQEIFLDQNYPNPFNPSTRFIFTVQQAGFVTLNVYDLIGRGVATLVEGELSPGTYQTVWNASLLSSGVYLFQLRAGDFVSTKKMILQK